jgi:hypothetical protein
MRDANMKVLQNFLFLLEDGDFDFEEDLGKPQSVYTLTRITDSNRKYRIGNASPVGCGQDSRKHCY